MLHATDFEKYNKYWHNATFGRRPSTFLLMVKKNAKIYTKLGFQIQTNSFELKRKTKKH